MGMLNSSIQNQGDISAGYNRMRQQQLEQRKQELTEKYAPWQMAGNLLMGGAQAAGGIMTAMNQQPLVNNTTVNGPAANGNTVWNGQTYAPGFYANAEHRAAVEAQNNPGSDERIKDMIAPAENLSPVEIWSQGLNPFYYTYKEGTPYFDGGITHLGVSAQELEQLPGVSSVVEDENGILTVDANQQVLVNAAVIAELCKAVVMLNDKVGFLEELAQTQMSAMNPAMASMQQQEPQQMAEGGPVTEAERPQYSEEARKVLEEIKRRNAQSANSPNLANPSPEPKTDGATSVPTATPQRKKLGGKVSKGVTTKFGK